MIVYQPLKGARELLVTYYSPPPFPRWVQGYSVHFDNPMWVQLLIWIFLVVPVAVFVYYVYEPRWSRTLRKNLAEKLAKTFHEVDKHI